MDPLINIEYKNKLVARFDATDASTINDIVKMLRPRVARGKGSVTLISQKTMTPLKLLGRSLAENGIEGGETVTVHTGLKCQ